MGWVARSEIIRRPGRALWNTLTAVIHQGGSETEGTYVGIAFLSQRRYTDTCNQAGWRERSNQCDYIRGHLHTATTVHASLTTKRKGDPAPRRRTFAAPQDELYIGGAFTPASLEACAALPKRTPVSWNIIPLPPRYVTLT